MFDDPTLINARNEAQSATQAFNQSQAQGLTLPDQLREALNQKFSTNNPLIQEREGALKTYMNETTQAPLDYTHKSAGGNSDVIYSPLQQANLIQARRSSALAPITSLNTLLGIHTGGIQNIIDSTSRAQQAETTRLQGEATLKRQGYEDILTELAKKADEAYRQKQFEADENYRQAQLALEYAKLAQSGSGGTATERESNDALSQLKADAKQGVTFTDLLTRYGDILPEYKIRQSYNDVNYYQKPATESSAEAKQIISGVKTVSGQNLVQKNKQNINDIKTAMSQIKTAEQSLSKSGSGLKYTAYPLRTKAPGALGIGDKGADTNAAFANVNTQLFKIAGTQFPKNEEALLGGIVLSLDKDISANQKSLNRSRERLNDQLVSLLKLDIEDVNTLRESGYTEEEIYNLLIK